MNTMSDDLHLARVMLRRSGLSLLDAARLIHQILDFRSPSDDLGAVAFCSKVIHAGLAQRHVKEVSVQDGFDLYLKTKVHLRPASLHDVSYLGRRLLRSCPQFAGASFASLSLQDCEQWLASTFTTASQFNKGRAMLHGLFQFAARREWCSRNVVSLIAKKRVIEKEIQALSLTESQSLIKTAEQPDFLSCSPAVGLLLWAGLRPAEVQRLRWGDVDLKESCITVRSLCSKTGGVRQVDICASLSKLLTRFCRRFTPDTDTPICPEHWPALWRRIRDEAGFKGRWVQDVLRHTFASYHAKHYKDLPLLQWNMGHRDLSLLRARYVNMQGLSRADAKRFFFAS